jgi:hypothetical protein
LAWHAARASLISGLDPGKQFPFRAERLGRLVPCVKTNLINLIMSETTTTNSADPDGTPSVTFGESAPKRSVSRVSSVELLVFGTIFVAWITFYFFFLQKSATVH